MLKHGKQLSIAPRSLDLDSEGTCQQNNASLEVVIPCRAGKLSLVSKAFKGACEDAQLCETLMTVSSHCFVSFRSYLPWFKRYASRIRTLTIQSTSSCDSLLAQNRAEKLAALLEAVSNERGGLQHLTLSQPKEGWQQALSSLGHLQSLHVSDW